MAKFFKPGEDIPMFGNLSDQFNYLDNLESKPNFSIANQAINQFTNGFTAGKKAAGWHTSPSDLNKHLSVMNSNRKVVGHMYEDGSIKGTNTKDEFQGLSGGLPWLIK